MDVRPHCHQISNVGNRPSSGLHLCNGCSYTTGLLVKFRLSWPRQREKANTPFLRILLFIIQGAYICHTSLTMAQLATVPPMVDTHFIINNLLHTIFAILVFCADFVFAEAALVVNFFNLLTLYSIDSGGPRFHHAGLVAGPLSWTIVAIYWNGSMTLPQPGSLVAGILSSICMWGILGTGTFYALAYKEDYEQFFLQFASNLTMCRTTSCHSASVLFLAPSRQDSTTKWMPIASVSTRRLCS